MYANKSATGACHPSDRGTRQLQIKRPSLAMLQRKPFRPHRGSRLLVEGFRTSGSQDSSPAVNTPVSIGLDRSQSHATASSIGVDDFYGGSGTATLPAEVDPTVAEIKDCQDVADVLDIVEEEAEDLESEAVAAALLRCTLLIRANRSTQRAAYVSFTKQPGFSKLLSLIEKNAQDFTAKDLAQVVWAFATINHKNIRVLRALALAMEGRVDRMNAQDLSNAVWSMATLRFHPGAVLNSLALAAVPLMQTFQPKGLSMMLWGYARLEQQPPPEFMTGLLDQFWRKMNGFGPQAVSNIMYSLAKLEHFPRLRVCEAVERVVATSQGSFKCLELSNLLWAFVQFRYQPAILLEVLESRACQERYGAVMEGQQWGTLVWGAAQLGLALRVETLEVLEKWGLRDLSSLTPVTLCNVLWSLAIMGKGDQPAFAKLLEAVITSHQQRFLEPRLMRQVFQATTITRALGTPAPLPADFEATAHKWWRKVTLGAPISLSHDRVAKLVRKLGVQAATQHQAGYGMPSVDLAIEAPDGRQVALQVIGPFELAVNTQAPLGRQVSDRRLLEACGWEVIILDVTKLPSTQQENKLLQAVAGHLSAYGIPTNLDANSAQAQTSRQQAHRQNSAAQPRERVNGHHAEAPSWTADDSRKSARAQSTRTAAEPNGASVATRHADERVPEARAESPPVKAGNGVGERGRDEGSRDEAAAKKAAVEWDTINGDFMSGWTSLADWRSAKNVEPVER